ncbi:MAG: glycosyltransferase family 9 protein [Desulfovibrio sp.]|uniref:glycosyltransferase family 9 protein n=1 Tax=Desulfovibrio sp. 7SRBS1 TaxID=3378064 RepID=UPI003B41823D
MKRPFSERSPKNILVCQLRQIGDVLLSTPAVELLHKAYPEARIHFFTEKKCAPVLENNPHLHKVWEIDKKALSHLGKELIFYRRVASEGYDLVVDFQQLPRCRWVVGFSRAPVRLSYSPPWYTRWLYNLTAVPKDGYAAMAKASVLAPLGIEWNGERPRLYLTEAEKTWADEFLRAEGWTPGRTPLITVDPTHRRDTRRWPAAHYAALLDMAAQQRPEARFFLLYGPGERNDIDAIAAQMQHKESLIITDDIISLRQMAAVINAADLHLGNCSAPRHFAVAVDTPTLVPLGSTSQAWTFPSSKHTAIALGLDCQPCNDNTCGPGHLRCLRELMPERMLPELLQRIPAVA